MTLTKTITKIWPEACDEAIEWASQYDDDEGRAAWRDCERGDWMLGIAARVGVDRRTIVRACVDIAAVEVWRHDDRDERPIVALGTALAWCDGEATNDEVRTADAAAVAAAVAAAYAAYAAAYAYAADAAAARSASLRVSAEIVRRHIPWRVLARAMAAKVSR